MRFSTLILSSALLVVSVVGCKSGDDTVPTAAKPTTTPPGFQPKGAAKGSGFSGAVGGAPEGSGFKKGPPQVGGKVGG